jgi:hypothetical protein
MNIHIISASNKGIITVIRRKSKLIQRTLCGDAAIKTAWVEQGVQGANFGVSKNPHLSSFFR